jgi:hypothetical protein
MALTTNPGIGVFKITQIISLVKKKAFSGEKGLDTISSLW